MTEYIKNNVKRVISKAPGKIILIGEHAVVYGYPAILGAVNMFATATILPDTKIKISLPRLKSKSEYSWKEIFLFCKEVCVSDKKTIIGKGNERVLSKLNNAEGLKSGLKTKGSMKKDLNQQDVAKIQLCNVDPTVKPTDNNLNKGFDILIKLALFETVRFFNLSNVPGMFLEVISDVPTGGFGSSTAVAASVIKAFSEYLGKNLNKNNLLEILINTEKNFYDVSGADQTVVAFGGLIKFRRDVSERLKAGALNSHTVELRIKSDLLKKCLVIDSGKPVVTTGEVVEMVRKARSNKPEAISKIFAKLEYLTYEMSDALRNSSKEKFFKIIDEAGDLLIKLGIVTKETQSLIHQLKKLSAHVKVSGAGSLGKSFGGSGSLLCFAENYSVIEKFLDKAGFKYYFVDIGIEI